MGGTSVEGMYLEPSKSQWYLYVTYAVTLGISVFYYTAHFLCISYFSDSEQRLFLCAMLTNGLL